ncbi:tyrosine-type recombinase/integrase [Celeribacter sp. ULVN23_4]
MTYTAVNPPLVLWVSAYIAYTALTRNTEMAEKLKLTKAAIANLQPISGKQVIVWDTELRGFGVRISAGGAKSYILQRRAGTKERRVTICRAEDVAPDAARKMALGMVASFAAGVDPVAEKQKANARGMSLSDAFTAYKKAPKRGGNGRGEPKKPQTIRDIEKAEKRFAKWMNKPVTSITGDMVVKKYDEIAATSPAQAALAMRYLRAALNHINTDHDDDDPILARNPVDRLSRAAKWQAPKRRKNHIAPADVPEWVETLSTALIGLKWERQHRTALLFMLLTGCRHAEAMGNEKDGYAPLLWSDVDLHTGTVTFRNTKNGTDHILPIGPKLVKILKSQAAFSGDAVFSDKDGKLQEDMRSALARMTEATGFQISAHDLRRTFITMATEGCGFSLTMAKRLANHAATGDVTEGYIQIGHAEMRRAMEAIERFALIRIS